MTPPTDKTLQRQLTSVGIHIASYVVVGTILGFPWKIMAFWGLGLGIHLARTVPGLIRALRARGEEPATPATPVARPVRPADAYLADLEQSLDALQRAAAEAGVESSMDLAEVRDVAESLHRQRLGLFELVDPAVRTRLEGELEDARARAAAAGLERSAEAFEAEVEAIAHRLEAMQDASAAAERLLSRERTILHQIDAARLDLLRSGVADQPGAVLGDQVARVRGEMEAGAEVEEQLARARRATQKI